MRSAIIVACTALIGAVASGCPDNAVSRDLGARCDTSDECNGRCLGPSSTYPGGFCSLVCDNSQRCPGTSHCADVEGGVCLFDCASDTECAFLGEGWHCVTEDEHGGGVKVKVCRGS